MRLGRNGSQAHVGLDVGVIDAADGQVKCSHRVTADAKSGGWPLGLNLEDTSVDGDTFAKAPLGIATRNALDQAVVKIAEDLSTGMERRVQIASTDADEVCLNANRASGIRAGDLLRVSTRGAHPRRSGHRHAAGHDRAQGRAHTGRERSRIGMPGPSGWKGAACSEAFRTPPAGYR
jgi:hypothetical protein